ncbi:hypothetical protein AKJ16_DCAP19735 [Drosera capensis]
MSFGTQDAQDVPSLSHDQLGRPSLSLERIRHSCLENKASLTHPKCKKFTPPLPFGHTPRSKGHGNSSSRRSELTIGLPLQGLLFRPSRGAFLPIWTKLISSGLSPLKRLESSISF